MKIPGKRVPRTRLVRTRDVVVAVEVEAVIGEDDASEPCYEAETVQLLRDVAEVGYDVHRFFEKLREDENKYGMPLVRGPVASFEEAGRTVLCDRPPSRGRGKAR